MSDDDDTEFDRELMRQIWRADPWNRVSAFVAKIRVLSLLIRLAVAVIQSIVGQ